MSNRLPLVPSLILVLALIRAWNRGTCIRGEEPGIGAR